MTIQPRVWSRVLEAPGRLDMLGLAGVLVVAAGVRAVHLTTWSLWLDEAASIYHALNPLRTFPRSFPIYFLPLSGIYQLSGGDYVFWGRALSALFGVVGVWLVFEFCRRNLSTRVALIAALLLALNLYHLFWSQSIRYYTMLLAAQMAASLFFVDGIRQRNRAKLAAAGAISFASIWVHYSASFLIPVWVGCLVILRFLKRTDNATVGWATVLSIVPFMAATLWALRPVRAMQGAGTFGPQDAYFHWDQLIARIGFYFGPPIMALALASPVLCREVPVATFVYVGLLATLPLLQVFVIGILGLAGVTMHHAFVAIAGCAILAALSIDSLAERGRPRLAAGTAAVTLAYAVTMLGLYFTVMHGDRSRWAEAAALLKQHVRVDSLPRPSIHASEPSIVASYLGVPAGETLSSSLVTNVSSKTVSLLPRAEVRWYLIDAAATSPELQSWLNTHAARVATFEARTGPRDRTVWVYRVDGRAVQ